MRSKTIITALAATAASLAVAGPAAAQTVLVEQARPFSVDAAKGVSVYSQYDDSIDAYRLVARQDGQLKTLNVDPLPVPFDVDIGTNRAGALVAVYSRSIGDENTDLFRYSFASDSETRLTSLSRADADERDPSVWNGDIAFVRSTADGKQRLMVGRTGANGAPRTLVKRQGNGAIVNPALSSLRVAYVTAGTRDEFEFQAVHTRTLRAGIDRTIHVARSGGANFAQVTGPSWSDTGKALYFARTNMGSGTGNRYHRYSPATGQVTEARGRSDAISTAFIGGTEGLLVTTNPTVAQDECSYDDGAGKPTTCQLIATGPLTYSRP
ncbi:MAG TPA: hypothetical protein VGW11_11355 [Solirubrobacteraceae bacterium]|nr:hypothetical protein [Solirubrobacteraceae bacterium]